jgi:transposase
MRYELADHEWIAIKPMLPNKPRGVPRMNDRRVLNGIFWILRSGAPWRDLAEMFGPYTTCYNRFVRWRRAGIWGRIIDALAAAHDAGDRMIDTSIVRVHQHGACITRNQRQSMGRSRGGLTSKIHAVVDSNGLPVRLALSPRRGARCSTCRKTALAEQSIRNNRKNGNPYQSLYKIWIEVAENIATSSPRAIRTTGGLIGEAEILAIPDQTLRHQVLLLLSQNRSLHNQLNTLKAARTDLPIKVEGRCLGVGNQLTLTESQIDAFATSLTLES